MPNYFVGDLLLGQLMLQVQLNLLLKISYTGWETCRARAKGTIDLQNEFLEIQFHAFTRK